MISYPEPFDIFKTTWHHGIKILNVAYAIPFILIMNEKKIIPITTEYIKLGQFLKVTWTISSGSDAKVFLSENKKSKWKIFSKKPSAPTSKFVSFDDKDF